MSILPGPLGIEAKTGAAGQRPPVQFVVEDVEGYFNTPDDQMVDPVYPVDAYF